MQLSHRRAFIGLRRAKANRLINSTHQSGRLVVMLSLHEKLMRLCVGCGACLGICPANAVKLNVKNGMSTVNFDNLCCINCAKCINICPAFFNFHASGPESLNTLGRIKKIFFGYSINDDIRYHGASGGVVTSLLLYMLKHEIVNKVLVVRMKGFRAEPLLTDNNDEVISAQGSIYFKTFSLRLLPEIIHEISKGNKLGIVGLPCQIATLIKVLKNSESKVYFIGLICNHTNEFWYLEHIIKKYLPQNTMPLAITSRKDGWPGTIKIIFKSKNQNPQEVLNALNTQFWSLLPSLNLSAPLGCLICTDHLASTADIVAGDAWHPKFIGKDSQGISIMIARTDKGLKLIEQAIEDKALYAETAQPKDLFIAQSHNIIEETQYAPFKRKLLQHRTEAIKEIDKTFIALLFMASCHLTKHEASRQLLKTSPIENFLHIILRLQSQQETQKIRNILKYNVLFDERYIPHAVV